MLDASPPPTLQVSTSVLRWKCKGSKSHLILPCPGPLPCTKADRLLHSLLKQPINSWKYQSIPTCASLWAWPWPSTVSLNGRLADASTPDVSNQCKIIFRQFSNISSRIDFSTTIEQPCRLSCHHWHPFLCQEPDLGLFKWIADHQKRVLCRLQSSIHLH